MANDKIPIFNSEGFADIVADKVFNKIAKTFDDFMENISIGQKGIASDISAIKKRLMEEENKIAEHERRLDKKKQDIQQLREDYERNKSHLEYVVKIKPTLETLQNMVNFWKWKNWLKIIGIIIGIIIVFSGMVIGIYYFMRKSDWISQDKTAGLIKIENDIKMGTVSPNVRSIQMPQTDAEIDSDEVAILRTIKK